MKILHLLCAQSSPHRTKLATYRLLVFASFCYHRRLKWWESICKALHFSLDDTFYEYQTVSYILQHAMIISEYQPYLFLNIDDVLFIHHFVRLLGHMVRSVKLDMKTKGGSVVRSRRGVQVSTPDSLNGVEESSSKAR